MPGTYNCEPDEVRALIDQMEALDKNDADPIMLLVGEIERCRASAAAPLMAALPNVKDHLKPLLIKILEPLVTPEQFIQTLALAARGAYTYTRQDFHDAILQRENEVDKAVFMEALAATIDRDFTNDDACMHRLIGFQSAAVEPLLAALEVERHAPPRIIHHINPRLMGVMAALARIDDDRIYTPLVAVISELEYTIHIEQLKGPLPLSDLPTLVERLLDVLTDQRATALARRNALLLTKHTRHERLFDAVLALINHEDDDLRYTAIASLERAGGQRAFEPLLGIVQDATRSIDDRRRAVMQLGGTGDARAVEPLLDVLSNDPDVIMKRGAVAALGAFPRERSAEALAAAIPQAMTDDGLQNNLLIALRPMQKIAQPYVWRLYQQQPDVVRRFFTGWPLDWIVDSRTAYDEQFEADPARREREIRAARAKYEREARPCPICNKPADDLSWFYFETPPKTWAALAGRAGWMSVCDDCDVQVDFLLDKMN